MSIKEININVFEARRIVKEIHENMALLATGTDDISNTVYSFLGDLNSLLRRLVDSEEARVDEEEVLKPHTSDRHYLNEDPLPLGKADRTAWEDGETIILMSILDSVKDRAESLLNQGANPSALDCPECPAVYVEPTTIETILGLLTGFGMAFAVVAIIIFIYRWRPVREFIHPFFDIIQLPIYILRRVYDKAKEAGDDVSFALSTPLAILIGLVSIAICVLAGMVINGAFGMIGLIFTTSLSMFGV